jgi:hypothetical protein
MLYWTGYISKNWAYFYFKKSFNLLQFVVKLLLLTHFWPHSYVYNFKNMIVYLISYIAVDENLTCKCKDFYKYTI